MSPKLILALLVLTGVCTIAIGILFMWYKRKTSFTSSTMGNLLALIPSLKEKIPTLNSLLPISELAPSQNIKNALTSVTVPQLSQTPPDDLVLPPVLVPKLQMETTKPPTTISFPYHNMAFTAELNQDGKPLPKLLFIDVMVEKTQKLVDHIKQFQLGLLLVANVNENMVTVKIFDNYTTTNSQKLYVPISNLWDLEDQLYRLWIEVNRVIHNFVPELI